MRTTIASLLFMFGIAFGGAGCGGSSDGPPPPLSKHFQESFIAGLPVEQQSDVIKAQSDYNVAQREKAKAEADLREQQTQLAVAKNEANSAKLDLDSANNNLKAAQASADTTRINSATKEKHGAELAKNAADERVKYYNAYGAWLKQQLRFTEENAYWRESQYELAKARLAQKNNIAPQGFNHQDYVTQEDSRNKRTQTARTKAEAAKSDALAARQKWVVIQTEADKVLGKQSQFPDPLSPKPVEATDPTQGAGGSTIGGSPADMPTPPPPPAGGGSQ